MSVRRFSFIASPYSTRSIWFAWCSCRRWGGERQYTKPEKSEAQAAWRRHVGRASR